MEFRNTLIILYEYVIVNSDSSFLNLYIFTLPFRVWSSIVIVHEKSVFFRNISEMAETILIKKIGRNRGISVYKKDQINKHRKNYIF